MVWVHIDNNMLFASNSLNVFDEAQECIFFHVERKDVHCLS